MSKEKIEVDRNFLHKVAEFTSLVLAEVQSLRKQVQGHLQKEANSQSQKGTYKQSVTKAAKALFDFVS